MKVAEYRDLISSVHDARMSLQSAVGSDEQRRESMALERIVADLEAAECQRANQVDRDRAASAVRIAKSVLAAKKESLDRADAAWQRMAFAEEYR